VISVEGLSKSYSGVQILKNLSFEVAEREILALLGPNGAGKSTTLRILSGYLSADSGNIQIGNYNLINDAMNVKRIIGYMPESVPLYDDMRVWEYLRYRARLKEISKMKLNDTISRVIDECKLEKVSDKLIANISKGYRQRTGLADALIGNPQVLILDEPTSGLDPSQNVETRELIKKLGKTKTILLSTHILAEVEFICDSIIILNDGQIVEKDTPDNLRKKIGSLCYTLEISGSEKEIYNYLNEIDGVNRVKMISKNDNFHKIEIYTSNDIDPRDKIFENCVLKGWSLRTLMKSDMTLEEIFIRMTK
jgi:ABC-2 type transport system ATP-binding protein